MHSTIVARHRWRTPAAAFRNADDAAYLSGGHTLLPTMKQRLAAPSDLIDLAGVSELAGIAVDGEAVEIGALTPHAAVAASAEVQGAIPALAALAGKIGDPQVRNKGTNGGSIANNDPAADYPAALVGLGATVATNARTIAADDFFTGLFETALEEGEIVTAVRFPRPKRSGYAKFPNPGVEICDRGRHGGGDGVGRAHRRDRGGALRVPRVRHGSRARRRAGPRRRAAGALAGRAQRGHPRERRVPRPSGGRHGPARDGRRLLTGRAGREKEEITKRSQFRIRRCFRVRIRGYNRVAGA